LAIRRDDAESRPLLPLIHAIRMIARGIMRLDPQGMQRSLRLRRELMDSPHSSDLWIGGQFIAVVTEAEAAD
jgi:hypothetical protein